MLICIQCIQQMITIQNWATNMPNLGTRVGCLLLYTAKSCFCSLHFCVQNALLISVFKIGCKPTCIWLSSLLNWCNFCQLMSVIVVAFSLIALYNGLAFCSYNKKQCSSLDIKGAMPILLLFIPVQLELKLLLPPLPWKGEKKLLLPWCLKSMQLVARRHRLPLRKD